MAPILWHGTRVELIRTVRKIALAAATLSLFACRGEPTPRDYQNSPPAMTHPVMKKSQTPTQRGLPESSAEPSSGAEGKASPYKPINPLPPTLTLKDQPPTDSQHATQTSSTATTGTALAKKP
jgi:hypothetical protein